MKGTRNYMDLGNIFDEIFEAAQAFNNEFHRELNNSNLAHFTFNKQFFDENTDFYPNYSYPPMNVFMTEDRSLVFEFALAGFDEKDINLSFLGDYMVFSASCGDSLRSKTDCQNDSIGNCAETNDSNIRYFKRRLKMKDIEKQKYYVPLDKYAQDKVKAIYKNGILRVTIPPRDEVEQNDGIKIEIVKEGT